MPSMTETMMHIVAVAESLKAAIGAYQTAHPQVRESVYVEAVRAVLSQVERQWRAKHAIDRLTRVPHAILPPDLEAARLQMLAATQTRLAANKAAVEAYLGRPLSQEAYDSLVSLVAHARATMDHSKSGA